MKKSIKPLELSLLILVALLSMAQFQKIPFLDFSVYVYDVFLSVWVSVFFVKNPLQIRLVVTTLLGACKKYPFLFICVSVWILGWIFAALNGTSLLTPLLYTARYALYLLWAWSLYQLLKNTSFSIKPHIFPWLVGILIGWFGILQYLFLPDTRFLAILGWDDHLGRLISSPLDPGFTGFILVLSLLLTWKLKIKSTYKYLWSAFLLLCIVLTYSRASYLSLFIGSLVFLVTTQKLVHFSVRKAVLVGGALISLLIFLVLFRPYPGEGTLLLRTSTIQARLKNSTTTLHTLTSQQWVWGRGAFVFKKDAKELAGNVTVPDHSGFADNSLVSLVSQLGLLGAGTFVVGIYVLLKKHAHKPVFLSVWAAALIHSMFMPTFTYSLTCLLILWVSVTED